MSLSRSTKLALGVVVLIVGVPFLLRLFLLQTRGFNPDELEHLHWSWCVWKGLVPYRDYFDHHTPWLHVFLSSLFRFYDVERVPEEAFAFIFMARRWMWLFTGGILTLTLFLGKTFRNGRTGLVATLLLSNAAFFLNKSLEVRPAVPASALLVAAVWLALLGFRRAIASVSGAAPRLLASGLSLGAATMFTQKVLFVGPGFALTAMWFLFDPRLTVRQRTRFTLLVWQTLGFLLPVAVTLGYFASEGALWQFIDSNFIVNTRWPGLGARGFVEEIVRVDTAYVTLGLVGFVWMGIRSFGRLAVERAEPAVLLPLVSLVGTLPLHPGMSYQHFLLILPLFSLYAASALLSVTYVLSRPLEKRFAWAPDALLLIAVVALSLVPLSRFRDAFNRGNWGTLQGIQYVIRNSSPWETTFDGFTGLGLFRPQTFFHHFQHPHAFALQSDDEHQEMLEQFRDGRALPKMVFWTGYLREAVTPEIASFLQSHYVPSGVEPILIRPFDNGVGWWSDEKLRYLGWEPNAGREAPHVFFDDGWRPPAMEFGAHVRRTRTRRSGLIVPIRRPRDFEAVFRAHADPEAGPFGVELVVNGVSAGVHAAVARWQDYVFFIEVQQLRPGFNEFELRFSAENDSEDRRLELAVQTLELRASDARRSDPVSEP